MTANTIESCTCDVCKRMCKRPCWGTPGEIERLISEGYGDFLMLDWWEEDEGLPYTEIICPAENGQEGNRARFLVTNGCVFQNKEGLCELHNNGKPYEGRMAFHITKVRDLHQQVAETWNTPQGKRIVKEWKNRHWR